MSMFNVKGSIHNAKNHCSCSSYTEIKYETINFHRGAIIFAPLYPSWCAHCLCCNVWLLPVQSAECNAIGPLCKLNAKMTNGKTIQFTFHLTSHLQTRSHLLPGTVSSVVVLLFVSFQTLCFIWREMFDSLWCSFLIRNTFQNYNYISSIQN